MPTLKVRISYNGFDMELDGDEASVKELFNATKEDILAILRKPTIVSPSTTTNESIINRIDNERNELNTLQEREDKEYPSLFDLVKRNIPEGESEWVLVYCFYASSFGEKYFTRNDILDLYEKSNRSTPSRKSNLSNSLQTLFNNHFVSLINEQDMTLTECGIERVTTIIQGKKEAIKNPKKEANVNKDGNGSKNKSTKRETYSIVDLELSQDQRQKIKESYSSVSTKSQKEQVVLLCYLLKEIKGISSFNLDIAHTLLKIVDEKTPKVLSQTFRDIRGKDQYLDKNQDGTYSLNHVGEDFVKFSLIQGVSK